MAERPASGSSSVRIPRTDPSRSESITPDAIIQYTREMGVDHRDFFRYLPRAMGEHPYRVEGSTVHAEIDGGMLEMRIGAEQIRRIALIALPYCEVSFTFRGMSVASQQAFKRHFDLRFQRGGG